jgi:hypothetical protein
VQPYPRKVRYPNPLYPDSLTSDYDHDGVPTVDEFTAWKLHAGHSLSNMWYSDGLQASVDSSATDGCRGMVVTDLAFPSPLGLSATWTMPDDYKQMLDLNGDGCLSDDERDEDGDLLTNFDEIAGRMSGAAWWASTYEGEGTYPDASGGSIAGTDWLDPDTDGDTVVDGLDDQDHDDLLNIEELTRGNALGGADHNGLWVNPFNPCLPWRQSATCDKHPPIGADWAPFGGSPLRTWPMYRSWGAAPVYHDDVTGWVENEDNPAPPAHLIPMPGKPYSS